MLTREIEYHPHGQTRVLTRGPAPAQAAATLILLHGRGGSPEDMAKLFESLKVPQTAAIIPEAANRSWYPRSFLAPQEDNEPYLSSALLRIETLASALERQNIPRHKLVLLGFSQGACLASEFVARSSVRYGALIALSGGIIGPPGAPATRQDPHQMRSLQGMPIFLGSGSHDAHVPQSRVEETAQFLETGAPPYTCECIQICRT